MRTRRLAALALSLVLPLGAPSPAPAATPRPVEFPTPELAVTVTPIPLEVTRPPLELPAPPAIAAPPADLGGAPLPRFSTAAAAPLPVVRDPGAFACVFVAFRRASTLVDCGVHRVLQGETAGARDALEESVAIEPRGTQASVAYLWLGEVAFAEARVDEAERHYRTAVALGLSADLAPHAELGLGWLALRRGDLPEAQRALTQALTYVPPQPVALVVRFLAGVTQLLMTHPAEALSQWDTVAGSGAPPRIAEELLFWRGVALARQGEPDRAIQLLDRFLAAVPTPHPLRPDAIAQAGWVALERLAPGEAERRFLLAESAGPRAELRPQLRAGLMRAYLALGDTARAGEAARRLAIEAPRDPLVAPALLLIADTAARRGAMAEALDGYRQLLTLPLPPALSDYATYRLGEGLEHEGRREDAKEPYRTLRDRGHDEAIAQRAAYRLGGLALQDRDWAAARQDGETLVRAGTVPELREGAVLLAGEGAARGGDPNRAVALFRLALRERPESARAARVRLALGWALFQDGDSELAVREWRAVARTDDPAAGLAWVAIASATLRAGREAEALEALRQIRTLTLPAALADTIALDAGILSARARADQDAVQALEPLIVRFTDAPRQALVRRALGIARYHLGQFDLAERQFRQAAQETPGESSSWLGAGLAALAQNRLVEADDAFTHARLGTGPEIGAPAAYGLVLVAVRRGDAEAFRERATAFVDRYPDLPATPVALYGLVVAALDRRDVDQAAGWVGRLVRDHARSEYVDDALLRLVAATQARPDLARQAYRDLLARQPAGELRLDAWLGLADAALTAGDGAETQQAASEFLREAGASDPRAPRAYALLVRAQQAQGQPERALRAAEVFLSRFPGDALAPPIQLTRGQLLAEQQRWDLAQQAFEAARDGGEPAVAAPAQFWLGEALRARGDLEAATAAYLGAAYVFPGSAWATRGFQGAAQSYVSRQMPREAAIVLRKLAASPGVEPALAQWARQTLAQLRPAPGQDPSESLRRGSTRP